jgi:hypothetical protein
MNGSNSGQSSGGLLSGIVSGTISGIVAGIVIVLIAALAAPWLTRVVAYANPTCSDTRGARRVPAGEVNLKAPTYADSDKQMYPPSFAMDGNPGSLWVPPMTKGHFSDAAGGPVLTIEFKDGKSHKLALVCVNNGLENSEVRYANWGRVKTVTTWMDADPPSTTALPGAGTFRGPGLALAVSPAKGKALHIKLDDYYRGEYVESSDPYICKSPVALNEEKIPLLDPRGCVLKPTDIAGLSEVAVYEKRGFWRAWTE